MSVALTGGFSVVTASPFLLTVMADVVTSNR